MPFAVIMLTLLVGESRELRKGRVIAISDIYVQVWHLILGAEGVYGRANKGDYLHNARNTPSPTIRGCCESKSIISYRFSLDYS